ncbi:MAG: CoA ester lyase, partial [Actinomycetota bacterium]
LILDLEDAVAPDAKEAARANAVAAAQSGEYGNREVTIRANGFDTPWGSDDVAAIATSGASAVVVPKVESVDDIDEVDGALSSAGAPGSLTIWAMVETPTAILDIRQIAGHDRVDVLVMGTNDLAKELRTGASADRSGLVPHLAAAVLGARAAGKVVVDGVCNDVRDPDGFLVEARQGQVLGFDGKTLVHPSQVEPANEVWAPSAEDVEHARRVIEAFEAAEAEGSGVITVDGRMIENLHVDNARRALAVADAIEALG